MATAGGQARGRLADEVYDTLLGQLMSLRIVPGSRVTIDALARELGVSQTPIRDALNRMEADGLVVRVPHAGYRIPPQITRDRFEDMLEIRLLLEPAAARRAAERASAEQVDGLRRMLEEMAELAEGDGHLAYGAFGLRDAAFHDLVAQSAGQPARPRGARPAAHARAPVPARLRHPGHLPGHGRARRGPRRGRRARPRRRRLRHAPAHPVVGRPVPPAVRRGRRARTVRPEGLDAWRRSQRSLAESDPIGSDVDLVRHPDRARRSRCPERCS